MSGNRTPPAPPISRIERGRLRARRLLAITALVMGTAILAGAQSRLPTEPSKAGFLRIILKRPAEKPPVWFSHQLHEERRVACHICHHDYQGKRNQWRQGMAVKKCQACHGLGAQAGRPDVKNAFHRQCKGCHLKRRQQGWKAGPIECRDCHRET